MLGALIGDMVGAPYEFDRGSKTKEFPLFIKYSQFTDDSVMSIAVAEALLSCSKDADDETIQKACINRMQKWGRAYPDAGYGARFIDWIFTDDPKPYSSWGNGSAMRVSSAGWLYDSLERTRHVAGLTASVSHDHPEGIKGAQATAEAIWLARNHYSKEEIRERIVSDFGLNDGIESGLVKTPRVVVRDDGMPDAATFRSKLYHIYADEIIMWNPGRKRYRKQSRHFLKAMISRM